METMTATAQSAATAMREEFVKEFVMAGEAIFTIRNKESRNRYTFKLVANDTGSFYFASVLTGPDNEHHYTYMGILRNGELKVTAKSRVTSSDLRFRVLAWFIEGLLKMNVVRPTVEVFHANKCGRCGRKLTTPESVERGIGPYCVSIIHEHKN